MGDTSSDVKELVITNDDVVEKPVTTLQETDTNVNLSLSQKGRIHLK